MKLLHCTAPPDKASSAAAAAESEKADPPVALTAFESQVVKADSVAEVVVQVDVVVVVVLSRMVISAGLHSFGLPFLRPPDFCPALL